MVLELYALQEHPPEYVQKSSAGLYGSFSLPLGLKPSMTGRTVHDGPLPNCSVHGDRPVLARRP